MIKKSRKQFVPDELKDDKYWARRRKNNIAAKRSRDARRQKENQIAMRARYLEKEVSTTVAQCLLFCNVSTQFGDRSTRYGFQCHGVFLTPIMFTQRCCYRTRRCTRSSSSLSRRTWSCAPACPSIRMFRPTEWVRSAEVECSGPGGWLA